MTSFPFRWYIPAENPTYLLPLRMEISNCHLIWRRGRDRMVAWKVCDLVRTLLAQWHRRLWSLGRCFSCWDRCGARSNRHGTFHSQCASAFTNLITPGGKSNWVEDKLSPSPELYQHLGPSFFGGVLFRFRMDQLLNSCWLYMIIGGCNIQYIYILGIIMDFRSTDSFSDVQIGYWDSDPHPYPALLWRRGHKTDISSRFFQVGSTAQLSGSDSWLTSEDWQASHAGISPVIYV